MVIALHCEQSISTIDPIKRLVNMSGLIASYGDLGVPLFFIVSGYTMMLTFGDRARKEVVYAFYIRRFFRIAPLFWLAGACYLIKTGLVPSVWAPNGIRWQEILLTFSFLHWLTPQAFNSVVPGGWSIAVEMQFYLIFPFFAYIAIKKQYKSIALYALIALIHVLVFTYGNALVYAFWETRLQPNEIQLVSSFLYFWLPNQLLCFGFGFWCFEFIEKRELNIGGLAILIFSGFITAWGVSLLLLFCFAFLLLSIRIQFSWLSNIGAASYSMYLIHIAVLGAVLYVGQRLFHWYPSLEVCFVLVTGASWLVSRYLTKPFIEDPSIRLGKYLSNKLLNRTRGD